MNTENAETDKFQEEAIAPIHTAEHLLNRTMVNKFRCERSRNAHIERKKSKITYILPVCRRTRQTLWSAVQMLTQKLCCQTIHDCPKVVPLHYESE